MTTINERATYGIATQTNWVLQPDSLEQAIEGLARRAAPYYADGYQELATTVQTAAVVWWPVDAPDGEIRIGPGVIEADGIHRIEHLDGALVGKMLTARVKQLAAEQDTYWERRDAAPDSEFCLNGCDAWLADGEECDC